MELTPELLQKAAGAKNVEELAELARSKGLTLAPGQAEDYFARLHPPVGELADDELEAVSGGGCAGASGGAPTASEPRIVTPKFRKGEILCCAVLSMRHEKCGAENKLMVEAVIRDGEKGFQYTMKCPQCGAVTGTVKDTMLSYNDNLLVVV